jgi:hypothetical protein
MAQAPAGLALQQKGFSAETGKVPLGDTNGDVTTHYSAAELEEFIAAAERVCETKQGVSGITPNKVGRIAPRPRAARHAAMVGES